MILGLSGVAGSGKDTVADILVKELGFNKVAWADPLRDFLMAQDPWVKRDKLPMFARLSEVIEKYGWQGYKESPYANEVRTLIQRTGTEAGRGQIGDSVWINATIARLPKGDVVISDCRFPNEIEILKEYGEGRIVRVVRPDAGLSGAHGGHSSEQSLPEHYFDFTIVNDDSLDVLKARTIEIVSALR